MSCRMPESWDNELRGRVNQIEAIMSLKDKPELDVLICIFYKLDQIKQQLDLILK